jgi:hypothetical protein
VKKEGYILFCLRILNGPSLLPKFGHFMFFKIITNSRNANHPQEGPFIWVKWQDRRKRMKIVKNRIYE